MPNPIHRSYEDAQERADADTRTLGGAVLARARRKPTATAVLDFGGSLSRLRLAGAALALVPTLGLERGERRVGVLLPPGRGGTIMNLALALAGRCAVNLNHTVGEEQMERMVHMAGVRTLLSSRRYLQRLAEKMGTMELPNGLRVLYAEDILKEVSRWRVVREMAKVMLLPSRSLDRGHPDQVATIIFSSGTTGDPKGIQLTHRQVLANCESVVEGVPVPAEEGALLSPLPLFHSFGLVPGMWMPLVKGVTVAGQADPFDAVGLGKLAAEAEATILIATPTFARGYLRRVPPEQFGSLDFAVVGAERCPPELHTAFDDKYGAPLLEGYGCTELGPGVAINTVETNRHGSVGRPLSGVEVVLMEPETGKLLPHDPEAEGLIVVRSPARMLGYLGRPDLTDEAFVHGGYNTGDIGRLDEDGFLYITGRLARFAKIGGEMVPLDRIEERLQQWLNERDADAQVAVASVPDKRRGERLVVLHSGELPVEPDDLLESALAGEPSIWRPRAKDVHAVSNVPLLGTGKRDLGRLQVLANELAGATSSGGVVAQGRGMAEEVRHVAEEARDSADRLVQRVRQRERRQGRGGQDAAGLADKADAETGGPDEDTPSEEDQGGQQPDTPSDAETES